MFESKMFYAKWYFVCLKQFENQTTGIGSRLLSEASGQTENELYFVQLLIQNSN